LIPEGFADRPAAFKIKRCNLFDGNGAAPDFTPKILSCVPMNMAIQQIPGLDKHMIAKRDRLGGKQLLAR
jgi:hypothetical protein